MPNEFTITRRPETPDDKPFLRRMIVASVSVELMAALWPEAVRDHLLDLQYTGKVASLHANYPHGSSEIILADGAPAGWIFLDETPDGILLAEIMVSIEMRGKGIGTRVLREVLEAADAAGKPVRLSVNAANPRAILLYERLGFVCTGGDEIQKQMERPPAPLEEAGALGIRRLKRFWSTQLASPREQAKGSDWVLNNTLLCGLRVGLRETFDYLLQKKPSFAEFESWILARNGGAIDAARVANLNAALSATGVRGQPADPNAEPALTPEDLAFWDQNGYVILHNAVPEENCRSAVQVICEFLDVRLDKPETWYRGPQGHSIWVPLLHHPALWANRDSPRIHRAFAQLWGREDLWGSVDQAGFNPPEKPGWKFPGPHLHWDVSLSQPVPFGVQGILYLTDTPANQGAFTCVPGFHRGIETWLDSLPAGTDPRAEDLSALAVPIAGRAGDLVIWHHALPHGSSPNRSVLPRLVQYINMRPSYWEYRDGWR